MAAGEQNAEFIAAARTDIPALLAENARLREQIVSMNEYDGIPFMGGGELQFSPDLLAVLTCPDCGKTLAECTCGDDTDGEG